MNPENSQHDVHEEIPEAVVEEIIEASHEPSDPRHTGPVTSFLLNIGLLKRIRESSVVQSIDDFNQQIAERFNRTKSTIWTIEIVVFLLLLGLLMDVKTLHVSLAAEVIKPGGQYVTNAFLHMFLVDVILIGIVYAVTKFKSDQLSFVPSGIQNFVEMVFDYLYDMCESVAGHNARRFAPWCITLFLFIIISNWSGLIPGVGTIGIWHDDPHAAAADHEEGVPAHEEGEEAPTEEGEGDGHGLRLDGTMAARQLDNQLAMSDGKIVFATAETVEAAPVAAGEGGKVLVPLLRPPTASLNFTFAIAIMTMLIVQYFGFKKLGFSYLGKFFTLRGEGAMKGINAFVGILELISELSRILSFAFRLFGNIFAGEVMLATMAFLITFLLPIPFYFLELFVGFVQALVFMMLALIFFTLAEHSHGDESH